MIFIFACIGLVTIIFLAPLFLLFLRFGASSIKKGLSAQTSVKPCTPEEAHTFGRYGLGPY